MLLSAPVNMDHKEVVSGLKASVSPSGKGCGPLSSRQKSWLTSMPGRHEHDFLQEEQEENAQFRREAKLVRGEPITQQLSSFPVHPLPFCLMEVTGGWLHAPAARPVGVSTDCTWTTAILQKERTISSYPHVFFCNQLANQTEDPSHTLCLAQLPALSWGSSSHELHTAVTPLLT